MSQQMVKKFGLSVLEHESSVCLSAATTRPGSLGSLAGLNRLKESIGDPLTSVCPMLELKD